MRETAADYSTTRLTIYGAGAIGGLAGAYMAKAGHDVLLVDKVQEHVDAMNSRGLFIDGIRGELTVPVKAVTPEQLRGPLEFVFLAVKSQDTPAALDVLEQLLAPDATLVSLQNGINEPYIAERIGAHRTVGAFINYSTDYQGPAHIRHGGVGCIYLGELDGRITERAKFAKSLFDELTEAHVTHNVMGFLWSKQIDGSFLFASALTNATMEEFARSAEARPLIVALVREALAAALADGIKPEKFEQWDPVAFAPDRPLEDAYAVLDELADRYRHHVKVRTGVWRDIAVRKRETEADPIIGATVALGRRHGLPMPLNSRMLEMFQEIHEAKRQLDWANIDELKRSL